MPKQWHLLSSLTQTQLDVKSDRAVRLDSRCAARELSDIVRELSDDVRELSDGFRELSDDVRDLSDVVRELATDVRCGVDSRCAIILVVFCQFWNES